MRSTMLLTAITFTKNWDHMTLHKKLMTSVLVLAMLAGCATPTVVQTRKVTDGDLTCDQLKSEIAEAEDFENKARQERGMTGKNVAAVLLFWPALLGTYSNTEDAMNAAKDRQKSLFNIARGKKCSYAN
jgi:hypothetical protein